MSNILLKKKDNLTEIFKNTFQLVLKEKSEENIEKYTQEIHLMKKISHPNIAMFLGASLSGLKESQMSLILFYEILQPSERVLLKRKGSTASPFQRLKYLHQLSLGLSYLEGMNIYHGDLKIENLLCKKKNILIWTLIFFLDDSKSDQLKISDWGFSRDLKNNNFGPIQGSFLYLSPELFKYWFSDEMKVEYHTSMDVYSFSILAYIILKGEMLTIRMSDKKFGESVMRGTWRPDLTLLSYPKSVLDLLEQSWDENPSKRPSFKSICDRIPLFYLDYLFSFNYQLSDEHSTQKKVSKGFFFSQNNFSLSF